jgi:hypothetical protein
MASSFTLFSSLPVELRLQIWAGAMPKGRIIEISYPPCSQSHPYLRARCSPPSLLAVNQESRGEALQRYSLLKLNSPDTSGGEEYIPVDYETDTLFFNFFVSHHPLDLDGWMGDLEDRPEERAKVRRLAFRFHQRMVDGISQCFWPDNYMCYQWLSSFPNLKAWLVVLGEDEPPRGPDRGVLKFTLQDTGRARCVVRDIRKNVERARERYFDREWAAPKVKAYRLSRGVESCVYGGPMRQVCWETISFEHRPGCLCTSMESKMIERYGPISITSCP